MSQYNALTVAPGALIQADNAVIRRENTLENRRGYQVYGELADTAHKLMAYLKRVLVHHTGRIAFDDGAGHFTEFSGTYYAPSGARMRSVEARGNLYITTDKGVRVLQDLAGTEARFAGAPRSLDPQLALAGASSGFLDNASQCAYRALILRTDLNGNELYGYPSTRVVAYNTAAHSDNVVLTIRLHSECQAGDIVQFYRTAQVAGIDSDASGDEMGLIYQQELTEADITAGLITFTDSIIDELRGATLYTSSSQQGIARANERPPLCKDMALYKNDYLFFANTSTRQRLSFTLVGTGSLVGKTITLSGVTYSFGATEDASIPQVKAYEGGTSTGVVAKDIDETARSLVRVINAHPGNTSVYAYYVSGPDDLPGQILVEERGVGGAQFSLQASDSVIAGMYFPAPPVAPATTIQSSSTNQVQKNALYYSKAQEPEHVPLLHYLPVGASNHEILRIAPLRDSLIIVKEEGVFRLTGESEGNFSVTPLDLTVFCKASDSVVVLANQVFMLSNQGIVAITDTGVSVVSREIEDAISPLLGLPNLSAYTSGCAYESERSYLLSTISNAGDTDSTQILVYNVFTRTWTRYTYAFRSAIVEESADRLYFIKRDDTRVYRERKTHTDADYADPEYQITIESLMTDTVVFTSPVAPEPGWALKQNGTSIILLEVEDLGLSYTGKLKYEAPEDWAPGEAELYPAIPMAVRWAPWVAGQPGLLKQVREFKVLTDSISGNNNISSLVCTFSTDLDSNTDEVEITNQASSFGNSPYGEFPWGGVGDNNAQVTWVPANKQYCRIMNAGVRHRNAGEHIAISGVVYTFNLISERVSK